MEDNTLNFFGLYTQGKVAVITVREVDNYYFLTLSNSNNEVIQRIKSSLDETNSVIQEYLEKTFVVSPKTEGALTKEEINKLEGGKK